MLYPLYNYYIQSDLNLYEILEHYTEKFYLKRYGRNKVEKILSKVSNSRQMNDLFLRSIQLRRMPREIDFSSVVNLLYPFSSNRTHAVAVLAAAVDWDQKVNNFHLIGFIIDLRDEILNIFERYQMAEEMTREEYEMHANDY